MAASDKLSAPGCSGGSSDDGSAARGRGASGRKADRGINADEKPGGGAASVVGTAAGGGKADDWCAARVSVAALAVAVRAVNKGTGSTAPLPAAVTAAAPDCNGGCSTTGAAGWLVSALPAAVVETAAVIAGDGTGGADTAQQ